jgi:hypothetical protein
MRKLSGLAWVEEQSVFVQTVAAGLVLLLPASVVTAVGWVWNHFGNGPSLRDVWPVVLAAFASFTVALQLVMYRQFRALLDSSAHEGWARASDGAAATVGLQTVSHLDPTRRVFDDNEFVKVTVTSVEQTAGWQAFDQTLRPMTGSLSPGFGAGGLSTTSGFGGLGVPVLVTIMVETKGARIVKDVSIELKQASVGGYRPSASSFQGMIPLQSNDPREFLYAIGDIARGEVAGVDILMAANPTFWLGTSGGPPAMATFHLFVFGGSNRSELVATDYPGAQS